jgi:phage gp29-like protein
MDTPQEKDPKKIKRKTVDAPDNPELDIEIGDTGTILTQGLLSQSDYNPDLSGVKRIKKYDEMRLGDATVRAALNIVKLPITSSKWTISAVDDTPEEQKIKEFIQNQLLKNPNFSWMQLLKQVLTFNDYGNSVFEKVFTYITEGEFKGYIGWEKFGHRMSKTIQRWTMSDGVSPGIEQMLPVGVLDPKTKKTKTMVEIPKWKLLYFILDMEGSNYEGISILRPAYKHWYMKDTYYKIDAIASERQGLGVPIIKSPPQARPADKIKARQIAKNMRANADAYADLPAGFTIEMLDMKANSIKDVQNMVLHHDRQIMKSVLGTFLELGSQGGSGSYNLSEVLIEFFYQSEEYEARLIKEEFQKAINELIDLNFGKREKYPSLEHGEFSAMSIEKMATALKTLVDGNLVIPDDKIEEKVRAAFHLPEIDHTIEGRDELRAKQIDQKVNPPEPTAGVILDKSGKPIGGNGNSKTDNDKSNVNKDKKIVKAGEEDPILEFTENTRDLLSSIEKALHDRSES